MYNYIFFSGGYHFCHLSYFGLCKVASYEFLFLSILWRSEKHFAGAVICVYTHMPTLKK